MTEYTDNYQLAKPDFNHFTWHDEVNGNSDTIDSILFALTGLSNFVGAWTNSTNYTAGQRVIDPDDASIWNCLVNHTSAATDTFADDRAANPTYWSPVASIPYDRGEWANDTVYAIGDVAHDTSEGLLGVANTSHTSSSSPNTMRDDISNWDILFDAQDFIQPRLIGFHSTPPTATITDDQYVDTNNGHIMQWNGAAWVDTNKWVTVYG